jgi:hypothetical protein
MTEKSEGSRSRVGIVSRHPHFRCSFGGDFSMSKIWGPCPNPCPCPSPSPSVPSYHSLSKSCTTDVPLIATHFGNHSLSSSPCPFSLVSKNSSACRGTVWAAAQRMRDTPVSLSLSNNHILIGSESIRVL